MKFKRFFFKIFFSLVFASTIGIALSVLFFSVTPNSNFNPFILYLLLIGFAVGASYLIARFIYSPIRELEVKISKVAQKGSFQWSAQAPSDSTEIYDLSKSIDGISEQLNSRLQEIINQKSEQEAVFASMGEGVVALDSNKKIIHMNRTAAQILGISRVPAQSQSVVEVIRVQEILELIDESFSLKKENEKEIELVVGDGVRFMQVKVRPLLQSQHSQPSGVVLVLNDITRMRELEGMRKTFVANVSHELRTPLTSIQGFAETLLNPSVQDVSEIKKYVGVIQKHATRLNQIIEDLLSLSRLEKDIEDNQIELKHSHIAEVLQNAAEVCGLAAQAKNIKINLSFTKDLVAEVDRNLMEQAVVNLIENAIRYSDSGRDIFVSASTEGELCRITVKDQGVGIAERHLNRIFERFYRVDKARGREAGGTGLGLSIVKYIALAHKGNVAVQSQVGLGSVFSISFPLKSKQSN